MNIKIVGSLLVSVIALMGGVGTALAADQKIYMCTGPDGSIELTSQPTRKNCELINMSTEGAADTGAGAKSATPKSITKQDDQTSSTPAPDTAVGTGEQVDPRKLYRDAMLQGAQGAEGAPPSASNPAVTRRYLKTDRETYRKSIGATGDK